MGLPHGNNQSARSVSCRSGVPVRASHATSDIVGSRSLLSVNESETTISSFVAPSPWTRAEGPGASTGGVGRIGGKVRKRKKTPKSEHLSKVPEDPTQELLMAESERTIGHFIFVLIRIVFIECCAW